MRHGPGILISGGDRCFLPTQSQSASKLSYHPPGQWAELLLSLLTEVQLFEGSALMQGSSFHFPTLPQGVGSCLWAGIQIQLLSLWMFLDLSMDPLLPYPGCHNVSIYHYCSGVVSSAFAIFWCFPFFLESAARHYKYNVIWSSVSRGMGWWFSQLSLVYTLISGRLVNQRSENRQTDRQSPTPCIAFANCQFPWWR